MYICYEHKISVRNAKDVTEVFHKQSFSSPELRVFLIGFGNVGEVAHEPRRPTRPDRSLSRFL